MYYGEENPHSHDYRDLGGVAEERHFHDNSELRGTPSNQELARVSNDLHFLEREVAGLQQQLQAEHMACEALRKSSLNAETFMQIIGLRAAALRTDCARTRSQSEYETKMLLADLLVEIGESIRKEMSR